MKSIYQFTALLVSLLVSVNCLAQVQTQYAQKPLLSEKTCPHPFRSGIFNPRWGLTALWGEKGYRAPDLQWMPPCFLAGIWHGERTVVHSPRAST